MLRSMRDVTAVIRRDKPAVVSYIEKNFKVSPANASSSYDDIIGVMVDSLMLSDKQIQEYLDGSHQRGELPKPIARFGNVRFFIAAQLEVIRENTRLFFRIRRSFFFGNTCRRARDGEDRVIGA